MSPRSVAEAKKQQLQRLGAVQRPGSARSQARSVATLLQRSCNALATLLRRSCHAPTTLLQRSTTLPDAATAVSWPLQRSCEAPVYFLASL